MHYKINAIDFTKTFWSIFKRLWPFLLLLQEKWSLSESQQEGNSESDWTKVSCSAWNSVDTFLRLAKPICMIHVTYSILGKNCSVLVVIRGSRYFSVRVSFILLTFSLEAHCFTQPVSRTSPLEVVVRIKGIDEGQCGVSSQVLSSTKQFRNQSISLKTDTSLSTAICAFVTLTTAMT